MIDPRPNIARLPGYSPGHSAESLKNATGIARITKLASNESLWGPSPAAVSAGRAAVGDMLRYPEVVPNDLVGALARAHGLDPDQLLMGNGADELLRLVAEAFVTPDSTVLIPTPSFSAYAHAATLAGGRIRPVGLTADGHMDLEAMLRALDPSTRLIYLCTPNNPTGGTVPAADWERFLAAVPDDVLVVVDQAYHEFVDEERAVDVLPAIRSQKPVMMVRTFSKIYGLAGLRVGWAAAPAPIIRTLSRVREPFSVNLVAERTAKAALDDRDYVRTVRAETLAARRYLADALSRRGYQPLPSQANFLTIPVPVQAEDAVSQLEALGFIVRATTGFGLPRHIRITVAPIPVLDEFLTAFDTVRAAWPAMS